MNVLQFQSLLDNPTNESPDIVMQALNEAQINPQHDLENLRKELADEQAKNKQLMGSIRNQYSKISRLRKTYHDHLQAGEKEHSRANQANHQLYREKKELQEALEAKEARILELSGQVEVYKSELEASKLDANYFEKLVCERDETLRIIKAELEPMKAKLCDLIK